MLVTSTSIIQCPSSSRKIPSSRREKSKFRNSSAQIRFNQIVPLRADFEVLLYRRKRLKKGTLSRNYKIFLVNTEIEFHKNGKAARGILSQEYIPPDDKLFEKFGVIPAGTEVFFDKKEKLYAVGNNYNIKIPNPLHAYKRIIPGGYFKIFRGKKYGTHRGLDFSCNKFTPIRAPIAGKIEKISYDRLSGYYIKINHGGGLHTIYCHLSPFVGKTKIDGKLLFVRYLVKQKKFRVVYGKKEHILSYDQIKSTLKFSKNIKNKSLALIKKFLPYQLGELVKKREVFTYSGNTGSSTGPHLHFAYYFLDTPNSVYAKYLWQKCETRKLFIKDKVKITEDNVAKRIEHRTYLDPYIAINPDYNWKAIKAKYIAIQRSRRRKRKLNYKTRLIYAFMKKLKRRKKFYIAPNNFKWVKRKSISYTRRTFRTTDNKKYKVYVSKRRVYARRIA